MMQTILGWLQWVWDLAGRPAKYLLSLVDLDKLPFVVPAFQLLLLLIVLYLIVSTLRDIYDRVRRYFSDDSLLDGVGTDVLMAKDRDFAVPIEAAKNLEATVAALKKAKDYPRVGEAYASVGKHADAGKWFEKVRDYKRAALEYAKGGKTDRAAKLLMKEGDFATAARFFLESKSYRKAAQAFEKVGALAQAAAAYVKMGKGVLAAAKFEEYFDRARDSVEVQSQAANDCYMLLADAKLMAKVAPETKAKLSNHVAARFEQAKRFDLAAQIYKAAGNLARAGEVYVMAGKLREAAECFKSAGKNREASQATARHFESAGQWRDAGMAYAQGGDYVHAGDCYARASEALGAAECYEKGGAFFRAGLAYAHAAKFQDAIRVLQKVPETDSDFDNSRPLLGRCFFELHDYAHCAACLENHLMGHKVDTANKDHFYMLGMAYEQLGKLDEAREVLYKIRTVDVSFRDVSDRISNISSRISMRASGTMGTPAPGAELRRGTQADDATRVMETVESSLGGRYKLEKELGRGGMGVVFLARDTQLDRPVALKFLGSLVDDSPEFRERFVREARTAARINHPNIIAIYDISASVGKAYIAMEYVEGPSLYRYYTAKGKLAPREAANIIGQACSALAAIHDAGIVHRDIKPDNVLIAKGGLVKLTDFGLAKAEDNRMTRTGVVMGTPSYMAPEQVLGKEADARSDIYSLGLVFYECLSGQMVFRDQNVLERQLNEMPPPPSQTVEGVPEALDAIIMKCVAKKPDERYASAKELLADLRALAS